MNPLTPTLVNAIANKSTPHISHIFNHIHYINRKNKDDHGNIENFQDDLCKALNSQNQTPGYKWYKEYKINSTKIVVPQRFIGVDDSVDILGHGGDNDPICIIEIDASRADQVAKKILSRTALFGLLHPIIYVSLMYPDTQKGFNQCIKHIN